MKPRKFIPPPASLHNHGLVVRMPVAKLSDVTKQAIQDGRATMITPSGIRARIIAT